MGEGIATQGTMLPCQRNVTISLEIVCFCRTLREARVTIFIGAKALQGHAYS